MSNILLDDTTGYMYTPCECPNVDGLWYEKFDMTKPDMKPFDVRRSLILMGHSAGDLCLHQSPLDARRVEHEYTLKCK